MTENLRAVEAWVGGLLARLQPAQRRALNRKVAQDLRRSQAQRIAVSTRRMERRTRRARSARICTGRRTE
ncbi:phage virion morphogenesis protein [Collimonas sp. OK242]|uniref:phage virion morphogenesis protein n=1 Tax=Collimonas sp. OK242 TaxID=1798195 RepID=UPI00351343E0